MAVSMRPAGRPKIAADIGLSVDKAIEKRETFLKICRSLNYTERIALANGLNVAFRTVQRWYYGDNTPDEQTREDIIDWYERGKPLKTLVSCESVSGYF